LSWQINLFWRTTQIYTGLLPQTRGSPGAGGTQPLPGDSYFNTAFIISSNNDVIHNQVKSVPIQFFNDGLPAKEQEIWHAPWGPIGICICYGLSYTGVVDGVIRKGASMILVLSLDFLAMGFARLQDRPLTPKPSAPIE